MRLNRAVGLGVLVGLISFGYGADQKVMQAKLVDQVVLGEFGAENTNRIKSVSGRNVEDTYEFIKNLKVALNYGDAESFSKMVQYPLNVGSPAGTVIVENETDMVSGFDQLFPDEWRLKVINNPMKDLLANWRGILIHDGNVWFNDKIDFIYVDVKTKKAFSSIFLNAKGRVEVKPLKGKSLMARVRGLGLDFELSKGDSDVINYTGNDEELKYSSSSSFQLYMADINNDGKKDYILTYIWSGSMGASGIVDVYTFENGKRTTLPYFDFLVNSETRRGNPISEWKQFSLMLASPFLYEKSGKVYHGFHSGEYYLWENDAVTPIQTP